MSKTPRFQTDKNYCGSSVDLKSLAKLCSVGAAPIPDEITGDQRRLLMIAIAKSRRKRLINLLASAIADDIWREQQAKGRTTC